MSWQNLFDTLRTHGLDAWVDQLQAQSDRWLVNHGDYPRWSAALSALPPISSVQAHFDLPAVTIEGKCDDPAALENALRDLKAGSSN